MKHKERKGKKGEKEEIGKKAERKEQRVTPEPIVAGANNVASPWRNSSTVVRPALAGKRVVSSQPAVDNAESTQGQTGKMSLGSKVGAALGLITAVAGGGMGAAQVSQPHGVTQSQTVDHHRGVTDVAAAAHRKETPPKIVCEIKIAIPAGEENNADLTRLVSTIEKAASEHPEEPAPKISRAPGMLTILLTGGGMLISVVSAAQPGFVQWAKSRGESSVVFKTKNKRAEKEIALTGDYDVEKLREVAEVAKDI